MPVFHPFQVEQYLSDYEQRARYHFSESGVHPMTLDEFHLPVAATRPETAGPRALPDELEIVAYVPSSNLGVGGITLVAPRPP